MHGLFHGGKCSNPPRHPRWALRLEPLAIFILLLELEGQLTTQYPFDCYLINETLGRNPATALLVPHFLSQSNYHTLVLLSPKPIILHRMAFLPESLRAYGRPLYTNSKFLIRISYFYSHVTLRFPTSLGRARHRRHHNLFNDGFFLLSISRQAFMVSTAF
jgi:hypothetical protein